MVIRDIILIICCIVLAVLMIINIYVRIKKNFVYLIVHDTYGVMAVTDQLDLSRSLIQLYYMPNGVSIEDVTKCLYFSESGEHQLYFEVKGYDLDHGHFTNYILVTKIQFEELL